MAIGELLDDLDGPAAQLASFGLNQFASFGIDSALSTAGVAGLNPTLFSPTSVASFAGNFVASLFGNGQGIGGAENVAENVVEFVAYRHGRTPPSRPANAPSADVLLAA
jgi:hypothetical protein